MQKPTPKFDPSPTKSSRLKWFGLIEEVVSGTIGDEVVHDYLEVADPGYRRCAGTPQMAGAGLDFGQFENAHTVVGMFMVDNQHDPPPKEWKPVGTRTIRKPE